MVAAPAGQPATMICGQGNRMKSSYSEKLLDVLQVPASPLPAGFDTDFPVGILLDQFKPNTVHLESILCYSLLTPKGEEGRNGSYTRRVAQGCSSDGLHQPRSYRGQVSRNDGRSKPPWMSSKLTWGALVSYCAARRRNWCAKKPRAASRALRHPGVDARSGTQGWCGCGPTFVLAFGSCCEAQVTEVRCCFPLRTCRCSIRPRSTKFSRCASYRAAAGATSAASRGRWAATISGEKAREHSNLMSAHRWSF